MLLGIEFPPTSAEWTFFVAAIVILVGPLPRLVVVLATVLVSSIITRSAARKIEPPPVQSERLAETIFVPTDVVDDPAVARLAARLAMAKGGNVLIGGVAATRGARACDRPVARGVCRGQRGCCRRRDAHRGATRLVGRDCVAPGRVLGGCSRAAAGDGRVRPRRRDHGRGPRRLTAPP